MASTEDKLRVIVGFLLTLIVFFLLGAMAGKWTAAADYKAQVKDLEARRSMFIGERTFYLTDEHGNTYKMKLEVQP